MTQAGPDGKTDWVFWLNAVQLTPDTWDFYHEMVSEKTRPLPSVSAALAVSTAGGVTGAAQLAQVLRGVEGGVDRHATHTVLEALATALASFNGDGGSGLIEALTAHERAIPEILTMLERDPQGTRDIFARLSPIEAVRFLRFLDRQDPIGSERILGLVRVEDPQVAMQIYAAFEQGAQGGFHNPTYVSGAYNSRDGISLRQSEDFPAMYSFFRS